MPLPPLAARLRPQNFSEFCGQASVLHKLTQCELHSMLFYGPPGCGKTSLAALLSQKTKAPYYSLSAVSAGVKDVRDVIEKGKLHFSNEGNSSILFLDEIHRFSKSQQDSLLAAVEAGWIILIGATTEHPSFGITTPLLSRLHVYQLQALSNDELEKILGNALQSYSQKNSIENSIENSQGNDIHIEASAKEMLLDSAGGDARKLLGFLELSIQMAKQQSQSPASISKLHITEALIEQVLSGTVRMYDKSGPNHYDFISAFIKSLRGSDPDAALLYMSAMLNGGEDPLFIARRLLIFAAEDIGNAYPIALNIATSTFLALERIGMPEGRIILSQTATMFATCPKSNAAYLAINKALEATKKQPHIQIPPHLLNAPTELHRKLEGRGQNYCYPHDHPQHFVPNENYFPTNFKHQQFYYPTSEGQEERLKQRLQKLWPQRKYE